MKVRAYGHSCFWVSLEGDGNKQVSILADPWIVDHVIGDVGGRFPRVRIDPRSFADLDAIYLSHAHTDHLCPYSLIQLHETLPGKPQLLIPASLAYLEDLLGEYLGNWPLTILAEDEPINIDGVRVSTLFNLETVATNEDDVMLLLVENGREALLSEADAALPLGDPDCRAQLAALLAETGPETRVFLTTENELEATMASIDAVDSPARRQAASDAIETLAVRVEEQIAPPEGLDRSEDIWALDGTLRLLIGQGITTPAELPGDWNQVLFPVTLAERALLEQDAARRHGLPLQVRALTVGEDLLISGGSVSQCLESPGLEILDRPEDARFDCDLPLFADFPIAPLTDDERNATPQAQKILEVLNSRFLPWLIGQRRPPVEHLLSALGGEYRIRVRYGTSHSYQGRDYLLGFSTMRFAEVAVEGDADEEYWGNDLDDYLAGRADDFSTFCRTIPGGDARRLWDCLGMPYLNDDLIEKKLRLHFERAATGADARSWVLPLWGIEPEATPASER